MNNENTSSKPLNIDKPSFRLDFYVAQFNRQYIARRKFDDGDVEFIRIDSAGITKFRPEFTEKNILPEDLFFKDLNELMDNIQSHVDSEKSHGKFYEKELNSLNEEQFKVYKKWWHPLRKKNMEIYRLKIKNAEMCMHSCWGERAKAENQLKCLEDFKRQVDKKIKYSLNRMNCRCSMIEV